MPNLNSNTALTAGRLVALLIALASFGNLAYTAVKVSSSYALLASAVVAVALLTVSLDRFVRQAVHPFIGYGALLAVSALLSMASVPLVFGGVILGLLFVAAGAAASHANSAVAAQPDNAPNPQLAELESEKQALLESNEELRRINRDLSGQLAGLRRDAESLTWRDHLAAARNLVPVSVRGLFPTPADISEAVRAAEEKKAARREALAAVEKEGAAVVAAQKKLDGCKVDALRKPFETALGRAKEALRLAEEKLTDLGPEEVETFEVMPPPFPPPAPMPQDADEAIAAIMAELKEKGMSERRIWECLTGNCELPEDEVTQQMLGKLMEQYEAKGVEPPEPPAEPVALPKPSPDERIMPAFRPGGRPGRTITT